MIRNTVVPLFSVLALWLLAMPVLANSAELRPVSCQGVITAGPQPSRVECSRVILITHDDGTSSISFLVRDAVGAWYVARAHIAGTQVEQAANSNTGHNFKVENFNVHPVEDTSRHPKRHPLQGGCSVSSSRIACSANDVVLGFDIDAKL
jgi:hypothetical protein